MAEVLGLATREKRLAALTSIGSAVILVALKVFLAIVTGSLGVISEALHSILDFIAAVITYLSVQVADKPADAQHLYGHGKVESFSAFVETGLLLLTALYIIWEAAQRLLFHAVHIRPSLTAILILAIAMGIDAYRARALRRVSNRYPSEALEADALHFSTDVWSTFVVILGISGAWLGMKFNIEWLSRLDAIAALGVAGVIIWIGSRLGMRTVDALLDVAPSGLREQISDAVEQTEGVLHTERVRVRRAGQRYFVDVTISVPRTASLEQAHTASDAVERRIAQIVPADVVVHVEPRAPTNEPLFDTIRAISQRRGLAVHELSAHQFDGRLFIELHLEVDEASSLREAHRQASLLEDEIRSATQPGARVNIHIEPAGAKIAGAEELKDLSRSVQNFLNSLQSEYHELVDCHDVHVRSVDHKILVSCHCAMDGSLPITEVHDVTAALEDRVKERFAQIFRVTIHPEPVEES
ncbi:MAG TPA: cation-efflux pump [Candidatus Limnocylindrales bacterium]|jgi:cation diffusion facilitator family transporter|nr:cation-efflux pump [Candidatus Limnocylindrales bacterium]